MSGPRWLWLAASLAFVLTLRGHAAFAASSDLTGQALWLIGTTKRSEDPPAKQEYSLAPLRDNIQWSHAPFEMGECGICHESSNPKKPGRIKGDSNDLCLGCHEDIGEIMSSRKFVHAAAMGECVSCHNPHNASRRMLLHADYTSLCANCHYEISRKATESKVKHDAVYRDKACGNCHNPHASDVEKLLIELPFDLCVKCHGQDDLKDADGKTLTNFTELLARNPVHHAPIAARDCSSCHTPHGGENFRLLVEPFPDKFYAPYDPTNYRLCYTCHNDQIMAEPETTTLTGFRDGARNLHYLHVNKADRGRTCRACHEVHAAEQPHQIRNGVPFGKSGWVLKINYEQTESGGRCAKTCHDAKEYKNK